MSDTSPRLDLPLIQAAQAQKHVTHNEALRRLDAIAQLSVVAFDATVAPSLAEEGDIHALGAGASGAWSGHGGDLALYTDGYWLFITPRSGWIATLDGSNEMKIFDGTDWVEISQGVLNNPSAVGINATADTTNRLAVSSPSTLLSHEGSDHRLTINKATAPDTASLLFQDNWSGRAELGLAGDDDFHLKVSADGTSWNDAMVVDATSGQASFPGGIIGVAERLLADRTYYVRSDGSDANTGLTNDAAGAFATVQHAVDVAAGIHCGLREITIMVGAGTFAEGTALKITGNGNLRLKLQGAGTANTTISGTENGIEVNGACRVTVQDVKVVGVSMTFWAQQNALLILTGAIALGGGALRLLSSQSGAYIEVTACSLVIGVASTNFFVHGDETGQIAIGGNSVISTSGPVNAGTVIFANRTSLVQVVSNSVTWVQTNGAITGRRYNVRSNAVINTNGGGASFIPGDLAGITALGGQYV